MIIITGTIKLESVAETQRVLPALVGRAGRSRQDVGNIEYVFSQNIEDPTEIQLTEKWDNEASLNAHLKIPDEEFGELMTTAKIKRAVVVSYEATNERELMKR
jgi:quinol monooxygenase YgiN